MLSRIRAEQKSSELLSSANQEQQLAAARATRLLVALYPALKQIRPIKRRAALDVAWQTSYRRWFVWLPLVIGVAAIAGQAAVRYLYDIRLGEVLQLMPIVLILASLLAAQVTTRVSLRRLVNSARGQATGALRVVANNALDRSREG